MAWQSMRNRKSWELNDRAVVSSVWNFMEQPQNQERLRVELQNNFLLQKVSPQAVFSGTAVCIAVLLHIWVSVSSLGI